MEAIRKQVAERNPDLTAEEAYRLAGFSEDVIVLVAINHGSIVPL